MTLYQSLRSLKFNLNQNILTKIKLSTMKIKKLNKINN